ncbi:helix-hairpin-helix domain-containing protein [Aeromicrobium alkaliterrae]|uniref:Helix-hairpin-helix DNA-binding motif class 1 domain-containing protein n=1 Tax=Aeromicrobium alkaliterrae TaxID=302168 RepID=A0ABN2JGJ9_9ACTN
MDTDDTRAEIARRRLAQLVASFDEHVPRPAEEAAPTDTSGSVAPGPPGHRRVTSLHVRVAVAAAAGLAVVLAWWVLSGRPQSEPAGTPAASVEAGSTSGPVETGEIVVDVSGLVQRPGIVTLPAGSRVHEAIEAAGGLAGVVDTSGLNLARKLVDGEQVLVGIAPVVPAGGGASAGGATNLNTATLEQLDELPGVGPVTAESIITWRTENGPFTSVEDLLEVSGIGTATLDDLRDLVTV